jgi:hypothetical protein
MNWKDYEWSVHKAYGIRRPFSIWRHYHGGRLVTEKNHNKPLITVADNSAEIRTGYLQTASLYFNYRNSLLGNSGLPKLDFGATTMEFQS